MANNLIRDSKVVIADRKKKYPKLGGPRKYPKKYCWTLLSNKLVIREVRYFKSNNKGAYHFFHYKGSVTTRGMRVPHDMFLYETYKDAFQDVPEVHHE
nr:hypothetical protein [uncultured Mediterranean phage uvMED]